jgi:hypothetical protein
MYVLRSQQLSHTAGYGISFVAPVGAVRDFLLSIRLVDELIYSLIVDTDGQYCAVPYRTVPYRTKDEKISYRTVLETNLVRSRCMVQGGLSHFHVAMGSSCRNCKSSTIDPKMVIPGAAVWGIMELAQQRQDPTTRGLWRLNHLPR